MRHTQFRRNLFNNYSWFVGIKFLVVLRIKATAKEIEAAYPEYFIHIASTEEEK